MSFTLIAVLLFVPAGVEAQTARDAEGHGQRNRHSFRRSDFDT